MDTSTNITRRRFLHGVPVALAAASAIPLGFAGGAAMAASIPARPRGVTDLIAAHRASLRAISKACKESDRVDRECDRSGHTDARARLGAATSAEVAAAVTLIASRPTTAAEATAKRNYLLGSVPFRDGWWAEDCTERFLRQLIEASCVVEGGAA